VEINDGRLGNCTHINCTTVWRCLELANSVPWGLRQYTLFSHFSGVCSSVTTVVPWCLWWHSLFFISTILHCCVHWHTLTSLFVTTVLLSASIYNRLKGTFEQRTLTCQTGQLAAVADKNPLSAWKLGLLQIEYLIYQYLFTFLSLSAIMQSSKFDSILDLCNAKLSITPEVDGTITFNKLHVVNVLHTLSNAS